MQMLIGYKKQVEKNQMTDRWRRLTPLERETLQYLFSINYIDKENGKINGTNHEEWTTQDELNKFHMLLCTIKPRE